VQNSFLEILRDKEGNRVALLGRIRQS
jgi:hypothetical protein